MLDGLAFHESLFGLGELIRRHVYLERYCLRTYGTAYYLLDPLNLFLLRNLAPWSEQYRFHWATVSLDLIHWARACAQT